MSNKTSFQAPLEKASHLPTSAGRSRASSAKVKKELVNDPESSDIDSSLRNIKSSDYTDSSKEEPECQIVAAKIKSKVSKRQVVKKEQEQDEEVGMIDSLKRTSPWVDFPLKQCLFTDLCLCVRGCR